MQQTKGKRSSESGFRPHVWGSFFISRFQGELPPIVRHPVFVPMFGDLFLSETVRRYHGVAGTDVFVPMFGDLFL